MAAPEATGKELRRRKAPSALAGELLAGAACVAVVAAIVYPVFAQTRHSGPTPGLSQAKRIGTATLIYAGDFDDQWPLGAPTGRTTALGWAGRVAPYLKYDDAFRATENTEKAGGEGGSPVDFGFNANAARVPRVGDLPQQGNVILIFEAAGARADLGLADARCERPRLSPVGDGTPGGLRDSLAPGTTPKVRYALGLLAAPWDAGPHRKERGGLVVFADSSVKACTPANLARIGRDWSFQMR